MSLVDPNVVVALIGLIGAVGVATIAALGSGRDLARIKAQVEILKELPENSSAAESMRAARDAAIARHARNVTERRTVWGDRILFACGVIAALAMVGNGVFALRSGDTWTAITSLLIGLFFASTSSVYWPK